MKFQVLIQAGTMEGYDKVSVAAAELATVTVLALVTEMAREDTSVV